jgi:hypothetical protein
MLQFRELTDVKAEDVRFQVAFDGAQFDARDHTQTQLNTDGGRFRETRNGIVIGERARRQAGRSCRSDHLAGRSRTVGGRRVRVKVHELVLRRADSLQFSERSTAHDV